MGTEVKNRVRGVRTEVRVCVSNIITRRQRHAFPIRLTNYTYVNTIITAVHFFGTLKSPVITEKPEKGLLVPKDSDSKNLHGQLLVFAIKNLRTCTCVS